MFPKWTLTIELSQVHTYGYTFAQKDSAWPRLYLQPKNLLVSVPQVASNLRKAGSASPGDMSHHRGPPKMFATVI